MVAAEVVAQVAASGAAFVGIVGFGSLLSAESAAFTCPGVRGFQLGRVRGWRRVFGHPAHIFFARGIAKPATREIASLCAEPSGDPSKGFVMSAFEVPVAELAALVRPLLANKQHPFATPTPLSCRQLVVRNADTISLVFICFHRSSSAKRNSTSSRSISSLSTATAGVMSRWGAGTCAHGPPTPKCWTAAGTARSTRRRCRRSTASRRSGRAGARSRGCCPRPCTAGTACWHLKRKVRPHRPRALRTQLAIPISR